MRIAQDISEPRTFETTSFADINRLGRQLAQFPSQGTAVSALWSVGGGSPQSSGSFTTEFPSKPPQKKFTHSIVVVGNGMSVLNSGLGNKIDQFDEVARFNFYQTKGFENDVGTRTTIMVMAQIKDPKDMPGDGRLERVRRIICPYLYRTPLCKAVNAPCKVPREKRALLAEKLATLKKKYTDLKVGDKTTVTTMQETDVLYTKYKLYEKYPSSGLQALTYFTQYFEKVHYTGFDFGSGSHDHYFEKKMKNETCHNMRDEARVIQAMEAEGILERLDGSNPLLRIPAEALYKSVTHGYDPDCKIVCGVKGPAPKKYHAPGGFLPYGVCKKYHAPGGLLPWEKRKVPPKARRKKRGL